MKTFGRILIILTVFAMVMGITYAVVSAGGSSTSANLPASARGGEDLRPFAGERPGFDREGPRGGAWMFGLIKDLGIVVFIVVLIVIPRSLIRRKLVPARVQ